LCGIPYDASAQEILCRVMRVSQSTFGPDVGDLPSAVRAAAGPGARPADWSEVKACYEKFGLSYFHKLGLGGYPNNRALVLRNGERYAGAGRAYFIALQGGRLPPGWLAHDNVGGYQISLGSWHDRLPALYVVNDPVNGQRPVPNRITTQDNAVSWFLYDLVALSSALAVLGLTIAYLRPSPTRKVKRILIVTSTSIVLICIGYLVFWLAQQLIRVVATHFEAITVCGAILIGFALIVYLSRRHEQYVASLSPGERWQYEERQRRSREQVENPYIGSSMYDREGRPRY